MKKNLINILFCMFILLLLGKSAYAKNRIVINMVGNEDRAPKISMTEEGPKGLLVDILKYIESKTDYSFNLRLYPWNRAYEIAKRGEAAIIGLSKNIQRQAIFDYSSVIYYDDVVLVVTKGNEFPFNDIHDLKGKTIGGTFGATYGDEYDYGVKNVFTLDAAASEKQKMLKLLNAHLDAVAISPGRYAVDSIIAKDPRLVKAKDRFVVLERPLAKDPNFIGFAKVMKMRHVLDEINRIVEQGHVNGDIAKIVKKWEQ